MEVLDEPAVVLFGSDNRYQPQLLARKRRPTPIPAAARGIKAVTFSGGKIIAAEFKGERVSIFVGQGASEFKGDPSGQAFVIVWASKAAIPHLNSWIEVKAEPLQGDRLNEILILDPVPFEFEQTEGVVVVNSVPVWT